MSICYVFYYLYNVHKNQATQHRIFNSQQSEKVTKLALRDLKHTSSFNILISFEILDFQIPSSYLTSFRTDSLQDFPGFKGKKKKKENTCPCFSSAKWGSVKICYYDTGENLQNEKNDAEDWTSMPVSQVFTSDLFLSHPMYWTLEHIYQFSFIWHESNSQGLSPYCKPEHAKYGQLVDSLQKLTPNSGKSGSEHRYQHLHKLMNEESTQGLAWRNSKLFRF